MIKWWERYWTKWPKRWELTHRVQRRIGYPFVPTWFYDVWRDNSRPLLCHETVQQIWEIVQVCAVVGIVSGYIIVAIREFNRDEPTDWDDPNNWMDRGFMDGTDVVLIHVGFAAAAIVMWLDSTLCSAAK